jgi:hypothetical protein
MVSTVVSLLPLMLQLSAVPAENPITGKPWKEKLLPRCEDVVPGQIQRKWKLTSVRVDRNPDVDYQTTCRFTNNDRQVSVFYECGRSKMDTPSPQQSESALGIVAVPGIGRTAFAIVSTKRQSLSLTALDDDTPCEVSIHWPDPNGLDTAKLLMQDLLAAATPAIVGMSRLEANYLNPESPAGRALLSSPEAWRKEAAGIEGFINLARGYPRVVEGKTLPGLPDGKVALLGLCPIGDGLGSGGLSMPGILRALIDAPASAEACPKSAFPGTWWQVDEDTKMELGNRTLGVDFLHWEGKTATAWARAYLRDKEGALISVATDQVEVYSPSSGDKCTPKLRKTKSGAVFRVTCIIAIPDKCKKNPSWWLTHTIKVSGDKVTIKSDQKFESGIDCMPTAE